ncbi:hypothetical protein EDD18DRAFT_1109740 [Armillaria luteobubalina]|uniref:Uncharacterized protein n=1 Tax=Armillaria luteobubalina TaxID=153913 RepID=A0AA39PTC8_9AGAR|nr:hypothetical protein EDD18DRAFT_1109740 [Armillaria luteobubalina]
MTSIQDFFIFFLRSDILYLEPQQLLFSAQALSIVLRLVKLLISPLGHSCRSRKIERQDSCSLLFLKIFFKTNGNQKDHGGNDSFQADASATRKHTEITSFTFLYPTSTTCEFLDIQPGHLLSAHCGFSGASVTLDHSRLSYTQGDAESGIQWRPFDFRDPMMVKNPCMTSGPGWILRCTAGDSLSSTLNVYIQAESMMPAVTSEQAWPGVVYQPTICSRARGYI